METREVELQSFNEEERPVSVFGRSATREKSLPPSIEQEAGWPPEPVSTFPE